MMLLWGGACKGRQQGIMNFKVIKSLRLLHIALIMHVFNPPICMQSSYWLILLAMQMECQLRSAAMLHFLSSHPSSGPQQASGDPATLLNRLHLEGSQLAAGTAIGQLHEAPPSTEVSISAKSLWRGL